MKTKMIVSLLMYFVYIYLKNQVEIPKLIATKNYFAKKVKNLKTYVNIEGLFLITISFFFISNLYYQFTVFIMIYLILSLILLYQNKNLVRKESQKKQTKWLMIGTFLCYLIPTILMIFYSQERLLPCFYFVLGLFVYQNHYFLSFADFVYQKITIKRKK